MSELANCSGTEKHFCGAFENNLYKVPSIIFASVLTPICVICLYAIIWFEKFGTDHKRTLTNKLHSSLCWTLIYGIMICAIDIIRYVTGPMPRPLCFFVVVAKNAIKNQGVLIYDAILITRYVFIFWLKNPGGVKDDFWSLFLSTWITGFSILLNFVIYSLPIRQPMYYYVCADIDPHSDSNLLSKPAAVVELVSVMLFIAIKVRISVHQQRPELNPSHPGYVLSLIEKQTIADFTSNLMGLSSLASFSLFSIKVNAMTLAELNQFPGFLYLFLFQMVCPAIVALTVFFMDYFRCKILRETLHRESRDFLIDNHINCFNWREFKNGESGSRVYLQLWVNITVLSLINNSHGTSSELLYFQPMLIYTIWSLTFGSVCLQTSWDLRLLLN